MGTAYLVQEPLKRGEGGVLTSRINYRTLKPYGEVKFLFQWGELKDEDDLLDTRDLIKKLDGALCTFCDEDYIVPIGNPALIAMAVMIASEINNGRVRMLDWIRDESRYRIVNINLND